MKNKMALLITSGLAIVTIASLCLVFLMNSMGWEIFRKEEVKETPPPPPEVVSTQWKVSPASQALKKALSSPPKDWEVQGNLLDSPQAPYPFSCVTEGINPALSYAQNFKAGGKGIQVYTSAYIAGLAESGLKDKINRASSCGAGTYGLYGLNSLTDGYQVNVNMKSQRTKTIIFRTGDVVTYVIGDSSNGNLLTQAKEFDSHLKKLLTPVCTSIEYKGNETTRSPFSHDDYKGYYTRAKVVIPKVELPEIPEDSDYEAVKIGSELTDLKDVQLPVKPTQFPVWPELPKEVQKPVAPETPKKEADTEKKYDQRTEDVNGPGCGWNFTGSTAPEFDKNAADKENADTKAKTEEALVQESKEWQESVLKYWEEYYKYEKQAPKWNAYVTDVKKVSKAWDAIRAEWNTYWANYSIWEAQVRERDNFIARQEQAKKNYENAIQECKNWEAEQRVKEAEKRKKEEERKREEEKNKDNDESSESSESPSPSPEEDDDDKNAPTCPPIKPSIIDQAPPTVGEEPQKPADPRPVSERD